MGVVDDYIGIRVLVLDDQDPFEATLYFVSSRNKFN
jgi:hypothetical protein